MKGIRFPREIILVCIRWYAFAASNVLTGIELMHMIRKGQMIVTKGDELSFADQFYALAA